MKKSKIVFNSFILVFILAFFREFYCAIIYFYNVAVARSDKRILAKILDIKKDSELFASSIQRRKREIESFLSNCNIKFKKIKSFDNLNLFGEVILCENSKKWVIILHGYGLSSEFMYSASCKFYKKGYNILLPDLRGHGNSAGSYIGMGWHDRIDIIYWINEIIKQDEEAEITLYGVSMGASAILMATGEKLPKNVKYAISDCAFTSAYDIFKHQIKSFHNLPAFPILDIMGLICKRKNNYGLRQASAIKQVKKSKIPTLFIHGDKDNFVPIEMMFKLYENASCKKQIFIVKNGGHTTSEIVETEKYWNEIFNFLKK